MVALYTQAIDSSDTITKIKAYKLIPAKINSDEGAIIPKEATEWVALEPSFRIEEEKSFFQEYYLWILPVLLIVGVALVVLWKRKKTKGRS